MPKVKNNSALQNSKEPQKKKNRAVKEAKNLSTAFADKSFSELTGSDKDTLLKVIALRLNLILPD